MNVIQLLGSTLGLGLVSGINLYATVLVVGLGIRTGLIVLRPELLDEMSPTTVIVALLCGGVSLSGHSSKAGLRLIVNHSPEPFSNIALSVIEDGVVVVGTYVAIQYPYVMLIVVVLFVAGFCWFVPRMFRLIRIESNAMRAIFKKWFVQIKWLLLRQKLPPHLTNDEMPLDHVYYLRGKFNLEDQTAVIRCVAGKGIRGLRHSIGYLNITSDELIFVCKRLLRLRDYVVQRGTIEHVHFKKHLLIDRLSLRASGKTHSFYLFKDAAERAEAISESLHADATAVVAVNQTSERAATGEDVTRQPVE